jgi:hypothetical protein
LLAAIVLLSIAGVPSPVFASSNTIELDVNYNSSSYLNSGFWGGQLVNGTTLSTSLNSSDTVKEGYSFSFTNGSNTPEVEWGIIDTPGTSGLADAAIYLQTNDPNASSDLTCSTHFSSAFSGTGCLASGGYFNFEYQTPIYLVANWLPSLSVWVFYADSVEDLTGNHEVARLACNNTSGNCPLASAVKMFMRETYLESTNPWPAMQGIFFNEQAWGKPTGFLFNEWIAWPSATSQYSYSNSADSGGCSTDVSFVQPSPNSDSFEQPNGSYALAPIMLGQNANFTSGSLECNVTLW